MPGSLNIANLVRKMAHDYPDTIAVIEQYGSHHSSGPKISAQLSFSQLQQSIDAAALGLLDQGFVPGMRVAVMVKPGIEFLQVVFSLFTIGATVVVVDPGLGLKGIGSCLKEVQPDAFIGIPLAQMARVLFGWGKGSIRKTITVGANLFGTRWSDVLRKGANFNTPLVCNAFDPAAILFTSGSTGISKGVVYEHEQFHAQVQLLKNLYQIVPGEVDLPTFPLFGLFSPALGMTAVIPEMDFTKPAKADPYKILGAIRHFKVTNLFASPALLRRLASLPKDIKFSTLKRILSAGAPVPARDIANLVSRLNPEVHLHTPYGATESLPVATISSKVILSETQQFTSSGKGVCVGNPVQGIDVRIIKIDDSAFEKWSESLRLGPGEIGEIVVGGPVVTKHYFNRPVQTNLAKIPDVDGKTLHRMGDLGYFDASGRLWFCGRKSQRVSAANQLFHTVPIEGIFDSVPGVFRSALVGIGAPGIQIPVLCVEKEKGLLSDQELLRNLASRALLYPETKDITKFLIHPSFPVDIRHNSKIKREELATWAAGRLS
ncbi:MAG: peptide synthase [Planctomycetes bacterium]|nr:peptide synthase [Planctomycetota bacterium]